MTAAIDLTAFASEAVPAEFLARIVRAHHVLAVCHENPDADTIGAVLGITYLVEALGGRVTPVSTDVPPPLYDFLPDIGRFRTDPDPSPDVPYDLLLLADCATSERVGAVAQRHPDLFRDLPRVILDHHASNAECGPADWIDPAAAATCEMVTLLAARLGVPLDTAGGALATALMAGIVMDTATFAHPNATPRTLAAGAALVEAGAPLSDISRRLYRSKPAGQLRLFGRVLDRLDSVDGGRVIYSTLLDADLTATGTLPPQSEGIIDLLAQADEAEVAILFKEAGETTRISVRTKPGGVDATVLTGKFGGGGHARAAGATVDLPVDQARPAVLAEADRLAAEVAR